MSFYDELLLLESQMRSIVETISLAQKAPIDLLNDKEAVDAMMNIFDNCPKIRAFISRKCAKAKATTTLLVECEHCDDIIKCEEVETITPKENWEYKDEWTDCWGHKTVTYIYHGRCEK